MTRTVFSGTGPSGSHSSAVASASMACGAFCQKRRNCRCTDSGTSLPASPGPATMAVQFFGSARLSVHGCTITDCNCAATGA